MRGTRQPASSLVLLILFGYGCDAGRPEPAEHDQPQPPTAAEVHAAGSGPATGPAPATPPEPTKAAPSDPASPDANPPPPEFDPNTATSATVRVLTVHRDASWTACGIVHATGVIEVEVLDVGPVAPRMLLIVSCPADLGQRELLEVGAILEVELFATAQRWPTPPAARKLERELPRRYVKSLHSPEG